MNEEIILSRLLDKYEKSKHLFEPDTSLRRVMLRTDKNELPEYKYEIAEIRDVFNCASKNLERRGLISTEWLYGRPVLSKIILNLSQVDACYKECNRIHPKKQAEMVGNMIEDRLSAVTTDWIIAWRDEICLSAKSKFVVPQFCKTDLTLLEDILIAFSQYDAMGGASISMRTFSTRCYHDTKYFERKIRDQFLRIAAKYNHDLADSCDQLDFGVRDQLAFLGIYARPELYELSGNLKVLTTEGAIDFSAAAPFGIAIPSTLVDTIQGIEWNSIGKITFIENKTNYDEYLLTELSNDEVAIYQGGFLSPQKRKLFAKIAEATTPQTETRFWADIDLGGFRMFYQLQQIIPTLQPMRMSVTDILAHTDTGLSRQPEYWDQLWKALKIGEFPLFAEQINMLLEYKVTIEQESFL